MTTTQHRSVRTITFDIETLASRLAHGNYSAEVGRRLRATLKALHEEKEAAWHAEYDAIKVKKTNARQAIDTAIVYAEQLGNAELVATLGKAYNLAV